MARSPSVWYRAQPAAIGGVIGLAAGIALRLPALGAYVAAYAAAYAFPRVEEVSYGTPNYDRAVKGAAFRKHLSWPFGFKLLLGPSGHSSKQPGAFGPPMRVSGIAGLLTAVVWGALWAALSRLLPWPAVMGTAAVWAVETLLFFVFWQTLAAGAREATYPRDEDSWPAALADAENRAQVAADLDAPALKVAAAISGALVATAAALTTWRVVGGLAGGVSPLILAGTGLLGFIAGAATAPARAYIRQFNAALKRHLELAEQWQERWLLVQKAAKVEPPAFMDEHIQPPEQSGEPETHRLAFFQVAPGAQAENYRNATDELRTAIGVSEGEAEHVVVYPMPKTDEQGRPIPGTRQESVFACAYNSAPLPHRPHLATDLDNWTTVYAIRWAFDRAFVAMKLGTPDLVRVNPLHRKGTDAPLFETIWMLPQGLTYEKLAAKDRDLAEKLGADWVRVGRRTTKAASGAARADHTVSIVFGQHPEQVTLKDKSNLPWLEALDLEAAFRALKLGSPLLEAAYPLTVVNEPRIIEAKLRLSDTVDWGQVVRKTAALADKVDVPFLRVTRRRNERGELEPAVSVIYGARPADTVLLSDPPDYDPKNPTVGEQPVDDRLFLDAIDWDLWFRECGLVGSDGTSPVIVGKSINKHAVATYQLKHVPGLGLEDIQKGLDALKSSSKRAYIEVEPDTKDASKFKMMAATIDPLDKPYLVMDYAGAPKPGDKLGRTVFHDAVKGEPDLDWVVGPGVEGQLLVDRWEGDNPHLIISGGSGSGKSVATLLMLLQIIHNNHPDDVKIAMADPKTELTFFEDAPHVNHFIGLSTPGWGESPFRLLADLLHTMREEVTRRNTMFVNHPRKVRDLKSARLVAAAEMEHARNGTKPDDWPEGRGFPWWDGEPEDHPFMLPWQFIVIEECSTFFTAPKNKELRPDWEEVIGHVEEMARISRSAGFHIAFMTQYPTADNAPRTLMTQSRRVGLMVPDRTASMVIVGQPGLEKVDVPGKGLMSHGKGYAGMRVLFVREAGEEDPTAVDDRRVLYEQAMAQVGARTHANPTGALPTPKSGAGPSVTSVAPPDPAGLWAAPGMGTVAPPPAQAAPAPAPAPAPAAPAPAPAPAAPVVAAQQPLNDPSIGTPAADDDGGPRWDRPAEDYPDLDDLLGAL